MGPVLARAFLPLALCAAAAAPAADVVVHATREGDVLRIEANAELEGSVLAAWQVLTDYERLHEFIPNLRASRVVERGRGEVIVEQKGEARFLFFSYPLEVRFAISEFPYGRIVSRAVGGSFRELSGTYLVEAQRGRVRLRYSGRLAPDFYVPPLVGTWLLRSHVEETFSALVEEIERRQRAVPPAAGSRP